MLQPTALLLLPPDLRLHLGRDMGLQPLALRVHRRDRALHLQLLPAHVFAPVRVAGQPAAAGVGGGQLRVGEAPPGACPLRAHALQLGALPLLALQALPH